MLQSCRVRISIAASRGRRSCFVSSEHGRKQPKRILVLRKMRCKPPSWQVSSETYAFLRTCGKKASKRMIFERKNQDGNTFRGDFAAKAAVFAKIGWEAYVCLIFCQVLLYAGSMSPSYGFCLPSLGVSPISRGLPRIRRLLGCRRDSRSRDRTDHRLRWRRG